MTGQMLTKQLDYLGQIQPMGVFDPSGTGAGPMAIPVISIGADGAAPAQRTPTLSIVATSGTIAAGAKGVSIYNSGATTATVLGTSLISGAAVNFTTQGGDTLGAITYNPNSGQLTIAMVV